MSMRPIKFRAWDTINNEMHTGAHSIWFRYTGDRLQANGFEEKYGERFILLQFTGLKDKKGKEIYEGDIVALHAGALEPLMHGEPRKFQIVWAHSAWKGLDMRSMFDASRDFYLHTEADITDVLTKFVVIGNIWENPELLETK